MTQKIEDKYAKYYLAELLSGKAVPPFGILLRRVCDAVGISQPKLEKYAQAEYEQLVKAGLIYADSSPGSMTQEVISRVIRGKQPPSYLQTYVWITVIKRHYNDPRVKAEFDKRDLRMPEFTEELEDALWSLSGHQQPQAVVKAAIDFNDFSPVPQRLPRGMDIMPQTDAEMYIVKYKTKDLAKLKEQEPELQC